MDETVEQRPDYFAIVILGVVLLSLATLVIIQYRLNNSLDLERRSRDEACQLALETQQEHLDRALSSQRPFDLVALMAKPEACL